MELHGRIDNLEGHAFGPYEHLELIGTGAMAYVYRAWHPPLKRWVAIKMLQPDLARQDDFLQRFRREAELVGNLDHPNILPVFDTGQYGRVPYLVMPYVEGGTLEQRMRRPLPLAQALTLLGQLCEALEYAHARPERIVHRDVKPNNILLEREDFALLADFGIAKVLAAPSLIQLTRTGFLGTPEYTAPEQGLQQQVDARADVYSVGVILFEMLTGQVPFKGKTYIEILYRHVRDPVPSARALNPTVTEAWEAVLQRALAKSPADRYQSARALHAAMVEAYHAGQGAQVSTTSTPRPQREVPLGQLYRKAEDALTSEDWAGAIQLCEQMLDHAPRSAVAQALLAHARQRLEEARQRERGRHEVSGYVQAGAAAAAEENWPAARQALQAALRMDPHNREILAALRRAEWEEWLSTGYRAAQADLAAERWAEAVAKLDVLLRERPNYRDATALRQRAQQALETERWLAGWYDYGLAAAQHGEWDRAADAFAHIVRRRRGYRDSEKQYALALAGQERKQLRASLRAQNPELLAQQPPLAPDAAAAAPRVAQRPATPPDRPAAPPAREPVGAGQALPSGRVAVNRRAVLAALYQQGRNALQRGDYLAAVEALQPVAEEAAATYPDAPAQLAAAQRALATNHVPTPPSGALLLPAAANPGAPGGPAPAAALTDAPRRGSAWGWWVAAGVVAIVVALVVLVVLPAAMGGP